MAGFLAATAFVTAVFAFFAVDTAFLTGFAAETFFTAFLTAFVTAFFALVAARFTLAVPSGVAAWNDNGAASEAARHALTEAAGIQIPRGEFVLQVLGVYLLVLVPLNWLFFWLLGRVEWAWVAAPIIAVLGAGAALIGTMA